MDNQIIIRKACLADIKKINFLLYQVHKIHSDTRPDLFSAGSKKYTDEQLERIIQDELMWVFVATENGKVVGHIFCVFLNSENEPSHVNIKTLYIDDLCVDENCRRKGIGKLLYDYAVEFARNNGCYNVTLNVWAGNKGAIEFYESVGMKVQKIGMEKIL